MSYDTYFSDLYKEEQMLRSHGFSCWPTEEEFVCYLFNVNDKIDALAAALDLDIQTDIRGRLSVIPAEPAPEPPRRYWDVV